MAAELTKGALSGIRVADFSWVWAGPYCTALLGFLGAEVIKIESRKRVDQTRKGSIMNGDNFEGVDSSPTFNNANLNKKGVSIDISIPEGQELARQLVAKSDVVVANMRPGKMDKLHLGYADLKKVKPDIIMIESTGFGATGPFKGFAGYAPIFASMGGLCNLTGYADGAPNPMSGVQDLRVGTQSAFAVLAALIYRQKTGKGMYIDCSSSECITTLLGTEMMDYTMNRRVAKRMGNADPYMAPHGVYRAKGDDKWVSIACGTEEEWKSFVGVMGNPEWASDPKFASMYDRKKNEAELNARISEWTINYTHEEVMNMCQAAGVAAMPSWCAEEILNNEHIKARNVVTSVEHPLLKTQYVLNPAWKLSETPATIRKPGPCLGEDNMDVFTNLLGYTPEQVNEMIEKHWLY
ncbi:MAG: CaiB/BaiF CoA transferase family protein [Pyramidobacter sp.]|jgi:benzylsuccinate CoA-transferase BbsF subunit